MSPQGQVRHCIHRNPKPDRGMDPGSHASFQFSLSFLFFSFLFFSFLCLFPFPLPKDTLVLGQLRRRRRRHFHADMSAGVGSESGVLSGSRPAGSDGQEGRRTNTYTYIHTYIHRSIYLSIYLMIHTHARPPVSHRPPNSLDLHLSWGTVSAGVVESPSVASV